MKDIGHRTAILSDVSHCSFIGLVLLECLIIRSFHSSWASPSGLILLGGWDSDSSNTTEKIQEDGTSTLSFGLRHPFE